MQGESPYGSDLGSESGSDGGSYYSGDSDGLDGSGSAFSGDESGGGGRRKKKKVYGGPDSVFDTFYEATEDQAGGGKGRRAYNYEASIGYFGHFLYHFIRTGTVFDLAIGGFGGG